ncbi:hypothetical protein FTO70_03845 [Methanosarcina sp. KYL-1]|uniref:hypothetical protein n=1 Tax=Methanosarcina sp. KYL-1 TaxID=2602068 RepID=UPI0021019BB5|nr:hypothetical protein [Methanosarcina sp. KYL-1]MCQ1534836.1 hypothetical protein [Methanosarcina sp. KYL-1]
MTGYKVVDGNNQFDFNYPYQDLMIKLTESLKNQDYISYIDIVGHLKNMSILAFDEKDLECIEKLESIARTFKRHIDGITQAELKNSELYRRDFQNSVYSRGLDLKVCIEYQFSCVIERICISALRKTIFKMQVPSGQDGTIYYDINKDVTQTVEHINAYFEEIGLLPVKEEAWKTE